jgi:very-short-patch-repair endonuclease
MKNLKNISVVDFVIEDLLIFADGDYWHNLKDRRKKDLEKTNNLQDLGYKVLRFDGSFIKTEIDLVKKKITEFL